MTRTVRACTLLAGLLTGCCLVLGLVDGQDGPGGGKMKKDKGPKADKGDWSDPEEKAVSKAADKATKRPESERDKWVKEMTKTYPGAVSPGLSPDDFHQWFDLLAGRGREWHRESVPTRPLGELFDRATDRLGLGPIPFLRREDFISYATRFLEPGNSPIWKPADPLAEADKAFRALDRDGSGFLEPAEWTDRLRAAARGIDRDRDGRISLDEYRAYFAGRVADVVEGVPDKRAPRDESPPAPEPRVYAIRYGKMPRGLPPWFEELDVDQDGQIALHEWRRAGRPMTEFVEMDLNGDGLLPPDEYLRYVRQCRVEGAIPVGEKK